MTETSFFIEGMTCNHCVSVVTRALLEVPGVASAAVDLQHEEARVAYDHDQASVEQMVEAVRSAGFEVRPADLMERQETSIPVVRLEVVEKTASQEVDPAPSGWQRAVLDVTGMHCASCTSRVEQAIEQLAGTGQAHANLITEQVAVDYDPGECSTGEIERSLTEAGYPATIVLEQQTATELASRPGQAVAVWGRRLLWGGGLAALLLVIHVAFSLRAQVLLGWVQLLLASCLQWGLGKSFYVGAWRRARQGATNMDTLIALGCTAAYGRGLFHFFREGDATMFLEAGMILTIVTLGKFLEARSKGQASQAIGKLLELVPPTVSVQRAGLESVLVEEVDRGEIILIRPGDKVALDAEIISGSSALDESWVTGESIPVEKKTGDRVWAGTVNGTGALTARVTQVAQETSLAQVIAMVRRVQESRADVQRLADRVVQVFVPVVLLISMVTLVSWMVADDPGQGLRCMTAVLVVACPCALGLATPTAILVASGYGAQRGILVKEAQALETAGRLNTLVFDKTGTLTEGQATVTEVLLVEGVEREAFLRGLAAAELSSSHPFAASIVAAVEPLLEPLPMASALTTFAGEGIVSQVQEQSWAAGNERLMQRLEVDVPGIMQDAVERQRQDGRTPLLVAVDGVFQGVVVVSDPVKPTARQAVLRLQSLRLNLWMISGDHHVVAESIAGQLGIEQVMAEVTPQQKQAEIERLQQAGRVVGMVGDGVNDAPALAVADLGIALGTGTDVAVESADVVLMRDDLGLVAETVVLARATMRTIYQNLGWAMVYNSLLLPAAAGILVLLGGGREFLVPPMMAAAAMGLSSVSVVGNSLLLKKRAIG